MTYYELYEKFAELMTVEYRRIEKDEIKRIRTFIGEDVEDVNYDYDAIVVDSLTPVLNDVNRDFSVDIKRIQVTGFDSIASNLKLLRPDISNDFEEYRRLEWKYWIDPDVLSRAETVSGVEFLMYMISEAGYKQNIITSRTSELVECTLADAGKYPFVNSIYIRHERQMCIKGDIFKAQLVGDNWLFEDFPHNIRAVRRYNPNAKILWHSWPDDRGTFNDPNIIEGPMIDSVFDLSPIERMINKIDYVAQY